MPDRPGDEGLELEHGLEHALGDLGLVGRIRGHEFRSRRQGAGDRRAPRGRRRPRRQSRRGHARTGRLAAARSSSAGVDVGLGQPGARSSPPARRRASGTTANSSSRDDEAEETEHRLHLGVGVGRVPAHDPPSPRARAGAATSGRARRRQVRPTCARRGDGPTSTFPTARHRRQARRPRLARCRPGPWRSPGRGRERSCRS